MWLRFNFITYGSILHVQGKVLIFHILHLESISVGPDLVVGPDLLRLLLLPEDHVPLVV